MHVQKLMINDKGSFERLDVWQLSFEIARLVFDATLNETFSKDYDLRSQIRRSAISISSNIAEGHERNYKKEYIRFLRISKGSAGELRSQLYLAYEYNHISTKELSVILKKIIIVSKKLSKLISYLESN